MRTAIGSIPDRLYRDMSLRDAHDWLRARSTRRTFLKNAAVGAAAAAGPFVWVPAARADGAAPSGLHVNVGDDPRSEMTVTWCSGGPVSAPQLEFGLDTSYGTTLPVDTRTIDGHPSLYHHAQLAGLAPDTTYHYRASHGGGASFATGQFTTAPPNPRRTFRFATMGDMGATAAGATITQRILAAQPDCVFMVGDLCYADRLGGAATPPPEFQGQPLQDLGQWDLWLAQIEASAKSVPWIFTVGNHEMEVGQGALGYDGFRARITLPGGGAGAGSPTYVSRWGNVAFVALDGNDVSYEITKNQGYSGGLQAQWVADTLAALRADRTIEFIVVGFHHCAYCTNAVHGSDGGVRDAWGAFFDAHGVDLVVNGHNHGYERTHPVRAGVATANAPIGATIDSEAEGTVYVTAGAGGQAAYPSSTHPTGNVWTPAGPVPEAADWSSVRYLGDHSVLVVDVVPGDATTPSRMHAVALASDGSEVDRFTIERTATAAPSAVPTISLGGGAALAAGLAAGGWRALRGERR